MGLIDQSITHAEAEDSAQPWHRLMAYIQHLQDTAPSTVSYKLIINGRHGEGYHNVAESKYGTKAWDDHWSKLESLDGVSLFDAHLTEVGEGQAREANEFLQEQMAHRGLPAPQSYIISPLHRCLQTAFITWSSMPLPENRPFRPVVKEMIRECMGEHTCDRRSTLSAIRGAFPQVVIENGFVEDDVLWQSDHRESHDEHDIRTQALLEDVFEHDPATVISFTSHSGSIASLLRVLGHPLFRLKTGAIIPLLVKATRLTANCVTEQA